MRRKDSAEKMHSEEELSMKVIAHMENDFSTKFGIPRQSGLVSDTRGRIVFEPEYRDRNALRGLEQYSHLWVLWQFSETERTGWSPTVRPPRLGGNRRMGVFATRSPFRPNPIGLSCVKLTGIREEGNKGLILEVSGADLMNGTPILDIKPYLAYVDSHPEASDGFAGEVRSHELRVNIPEEMLEHIPQEKRDAVKGILQNDPRPGYQDDRDRVYGMEYGGMEIQFQVTGKILNVLAIEQKE